MLRITLKKGLNEDVNGLTKSVSCNPQKAASIIKHKYKSDNRNVHEIVCKLKNLKGDINKEALEIYRNLNYDTQSDQDIINTLLDKLNNNHISLQNQKDIKSIGAIMSLCNVNKQYYKTISLYEKLNAVVMHNDVINLLFIKACIPSNLFMKAHKVINNSILINNNISTKLITVIIDFYGKFGRIDKALNVFNTIPSNKKNVIHINAMMHAFNNNKQYLKAISLYDESVNNDIIKPNDVTKLALIKACINTNNYIKGRKLIDSLSINDSIKNHSIQLITTLIDFNGKSGDINGALRMFNNVPLNKLNVACINSMMNVYNGNGHYNECIELYEKYNGFSNKLKYDDISNLLFLKACIKTYNYEKGKQLIHSTVKDIKNHSIEFITTMIDFYGKVGDITNASLMFNNIPSKRKQNIITIGAMINAFNNNEQCNDSILLYQKYNDIIKHNDITNISFIKACLNSGQYDQAKKLIDSLLINGDNINNHSNEFINTLIDFYGKSGDIDNAFLIFNKIPSNRMDTVTVTAMMNAYINNKEYNKCILLHEHYIDNNRYNIKSDHVSNLVFCRAFIQNYETGNNQCDINNLINIKNVNNRDITFINTLIDYYGKVGHIESAVNIFQNIPLNKKDIASINAMMKAYNNNEQYHKSISIYEQYKNIQYDDITNILFIKSCLNLGHYDKAKEVIDSIIITDKDINDHSIEFITTLIDFYGEIGLIDIALNIFNNSKCDIALIGAMMNAYNNNEQYNETINLFNKITTDYEKTEYIYCSALKAAGSLVSPNQGSIIIQDLNKCNPDILHSLYIQSAMIAMYAKCNEFEKAIGIFNDIDIDHNNENKNGLMYLYASIMDCYVKMEKPEQLLLLFNDLKMNKKLNCFLSKHIYSIVLNGCSHSGLIDEAILIFDEMDDEYKSDPKCIIPLIDCLGRKGHLTQAKNLYNKYMENNKNIYYKYKFNALGSLLSSCRIHNNVKFGREIFDKMEAFNVKLTDIAPMYVILSNVYGQNKQFDKVNQIEQIMKSKGIKHYIECTSMTKERGMRIKDW